MRRHWQWSRVNPFWCDSRDLNCLSWPLNCSQTDRHNKFSPPGLWWSTISHSNYVVDVVLWQTIISINKLAVIPCLLIKDLLSETNRRWSQLRLIIMMRGENKLRKNYFCFVWAGKFVLHSTPFEWGFFRFRVFLSSLHDPRTRFLIFFARFHWMHGWRVATLSSLPHAVEKLHGSSSRRLFPRFFANVAISIKKKCFELMRRGELKWFISVLIAGVMKTRQLEVTQCELTLNV